MDHNFNPLRIEPLAAMQEAGDTNSQLMGLLLLRQRGSATSEELNAVRHLIAASDAAVRSEAIRLLGELGSEDDIPALRAIVESGDNVFFSAAMLALMELCDLAYCALQIYRAQQSTDSLLRYSLKELKKRWKQQSLAHQPDEECDEATRLPQIDWHVRRDDLWQGVLAADENSAALKFTVYGPKSNAAVRPQHLLSMQKLAALGLDGLWPAMHRQMTPPQFRSQTLTLAEFHQAAYRLDEIVFPPPWRKVVTVIVLRLTALADDADDVELFWIDDRFYAETDGLLADDPKWYRNVL